LRRKGKGRAKQYGKQCALETVEAGKGKGNERKRIRKRFGDQVDRMGSRRLSTK
jgi:hypothetical protein